jgi:hypothetical protein
MTFKNSHCKNLAPSASLARNPASEARAKPAKNGRILVSQKSDVRSSTFPLCVLSVLCAKSRPLNELAQRSQGTQGISYLSQHPVLATCSVIRFDRNHWRPPRIWREIRPLNDARAKPAKSAKTSDKQKSNVRSSAFTLSVFFTISSLRPSRPLREPLRPPTV